MGIGLGLELGSAVRVGIMAWVGPGLEFYFATVLCNAVAHSFAHFALHSCLMV